MGSSELSRLSPSVSSIFYFQLLPLIPYSAIAKTILVRTLIFHIFTRVENQPLKRQLKQKRQIIFKNLQNVFL